MGAGKGLFFAALFLLSFGYSGTYWDYVREISMERGGLSGLINLNVADDDIKAILTEAGFTGYRFDGTKEWILKALDMVGGL